MNDADLQELIDKVVAGRLSPQEEQRWNALLAERPELEEEMALGEALHTLPAPPVVSSNFTALVMQEIRRTEAETLRASKPGWLRWPRLIRIGATAAVMALLAFTFVQQREIKQAQEAAETIAEAVTYSPGVEAENALAVFRDFEFIRQLPSRPDDKLLSALAK